MQLFKVDTARQKANHSSTIKCGCAAACQIPAAMLCLSTNQNI
jgi:hypothetical protein